jgi:hypothetical protein
MILGNSAPWPTPFLQIQPPHGSGAHPPHPPHPPKPLLMRRPRVDAALQRAPRVCIILACIASGQEWPQVAVTEKSGYGASQCGPKTS